MRQSFQNQASKTLRSTHNSRYFRSKAVTNEEFQKIANAAIEDIESSVSVHDDKIKKLEAELAESNRIIKTMAKHLDLLRKRVNKRNS